MIYKKHQIFKTDFSPKKQTTFCVQSKGLLFIMENKNMNVLLSLWKWRIYTSEYGRFVFSEYSRFVFVKEFLIFQVFFYAYIQTVIAHRNVSCTLSLHCNTPMAVECCIKRVALETENQTLNREQWHLFSLFKHDISGTQLRLIWDWILRYQCATICELKVMITFSNLYVFRKLCTRFLIVPRIKDSRD